MFEMFNKSATMTNTTTYTPVNYISYNFSVLNPLDINSTLESPGYEGVLGVYDISTRAKIILSRPQHIIAVILGSVAIILNVASLLALSQVKNRLTTHFRLIISLSLSDILVCGSVLMFVVNKIVNPSYMPGEGSHRDRLVSKCTFMLIKTLNTIGLNVSLLNLMGMSIDHYIAITRPLHYPKLLSKFKSRVMIIVLWVAAILFGSTDFITSIPYYNKFKHVYNYCEIVWLTKYQDEFTVLGIALVCFIIMVTIYVNIYLVVKQHRTPGEQNPKHDVTRNKRALFTTLLILGSFVVCWLPCCIYQIVLILITTNITDINQVPDRLLYTLYIMDKYLYDLLLINCICDPIIYTVRTYEVQLGYKRLLRHFSCFKIKLHHARGRNSYYESSRRSFLREPRLSTSSFLSVDSKITNTVVLNSMTCQRSRLLSGEFLGRPLNKHVPNGKFDSRKKSEIAMSFI